MKQISNSHLRWPKGRRSCVKYISKERINNESVQKYISNFYKIRKNLKRQYIFLLTLFIKKQYTLLWFFLYLRNKV